MVAGPPSAPAAARHSPVVAGSDAISQTNFTPGPNAVANTVSSPAVSRDPTTAALSPRVLPKPAARRPTQGLCLALPSAPVGFSSKTRQNGGTAVNSRQSSRGKGAGASRPNLGASSAFRGWELLEETNLYMLTQVGRFH